LRPGSASLQRSRIAETIARIAVPGISAEGH
jgi:hypothetical protein